jgi:hypothetical protein
MTGSTNPPIAIPGGVRLEPRGNSAAMPGAHAAIGRAQGERRRRGLARVQSDLHPMATHRTLRPLESGLWDVPVLLSFGAADQDAPRREVEMLAVSPSGVSLEVEHAVPDACGHDLAKQAVATRRDLFASAFA